jgi:hypothetical protein
MDIQPISFLQLYSFLAHGELGFLFTYSCFTSHYTCGLFTYKTASLNPNNSIITVEPQK